MKVMRNRIPVKTDRRGISSLCCVHVVLALITALLPLATSAALRSDDDLPRQAAVILARTCLKCHDSGKKTAGIDLSSRASAFASGALERGDLTQSRLMRAVTEGRMPPTGRLPAAEIEILHKWVANGAAYPQERLTPSSLATDTRRPLWSFQPVRKPPVPHTKYDRLAKNPVDRFIFAKLEQKGLRPSPPASRLALLRRLTIDLTGLPPTPQEVAAFLNDRSPNAYEKVVDRLLASPAYGERWGRHWLDVVRYGESHGYEQNHLRPNAWPYRDYVIRAFNEDKPWPQFILEQLAGDVVGKGDPKVEAATGFLVAGIHDTVGNQTEEGTRQQRSNDLDDIVSTTGAAFLGLTVGCAKCHDHRFDPISQRDYYRLTAVFAGVRHGERPLTTRRQTEAEKREEAEVRRRIEQINNEIAEIDAQARAAALHKRGQKERSRPPVNARRNVDEFPPTGARFVRFTVLATLDGAEPCLDELRVYGPESEMNLALASAGAKATASSLLPGFPIHQIHHLNDGKFGNEWSWISREPGSGWAQIELPAPTTIHRVVWSRDGGEIPRFDDRVPSAYRIEVSEDGINWKTVSTEAGRAIEKMPVPFAELLASMTPEQKERRQDLLAKQEQLQKRAAELSPQKMAYIGQYDKPDPIYILRRGDVMQRGEEVTPGALSELKALPCDFALPPDAPEPERRLALARWLGDPRNPLTARVIVNRVWQYHFGRGIVGTPSDFGRNGEKPSHPELLDWLASALMTTQSGREGERRRRGDSTPNAYACGWRLKPLHRLLVTSYVYQQASAAHPSGMAKDASNQLLWRMPLRRMEAEAIRDAILSTSGKLDRRMGGPGFPLYRYRVVNVAIYEPLEEYGPETWRRSVYQQAARAIHDDLLGNFDCPESSQRTPRRDSTTTVLQALSLLNGPFMTQQARFFAERVRREHEEELGVRPLGVRKESKRPTPNAQRSRLIERAFLLAFGRRPEATEREAALALVESQGLTALCRALLNANELLYY